MARKNPIKILHITPHLGSGVGTVVLNYLKKVRSNPSFEHKIACLKETSAEKIKICKEIGLPFVNNAHFERAELTRLISETDIVLVHWWNHPLLYDFLVREKLPPSRVIFWSHVLGSVPPNNFTKKVLDYPDLFLFTTPVSYGVREVKDSLSKKKKRFGVVWSTGGVERIKFIKPKKHSGFNVGYIGTVDYTKMHPHFFDMSLKVKIPNIKFIVVGGPNHLEMRDAAEKLGLGAKFKFTGFVSEEEKWKLLAQFDIFGYPLARHHYGSSDQALQEAMGARVMPLVFDNEMEKFMVENEKTGIVVHSENEYGNAIKRLYENKKLRDRLSKNAKKYATKTFSLKTMGKQWEKIFEDILKIDKKPRAWSMKNKGKISAKDVFLESIGKYAKEFSSKEKIRKMAELPNWQTKSKGTAHQYHSFFPEDKSLAGWSKLMNKH